MAFAMKSKITAQATNRQSAQLGVMTNALQNVDLKPGAKLSKANFDDACLQFFTQADRPGGVDGLCGFKIELFATGTGTSSPELLGTARLDCDGRSGLYALMHTCTSTCMNDHAAVCCFVPKAVAWMFPCCRARSCCPDQLGAKATKYPTFAPTAPTTAPTPACATSTACIGCMSYGSSKTECASFGLDCASLRKATGCAGTPSASCQKCLGVGRTRVICHSFGLDCGCGKTVPSSRRRALGTASNRKHSMPRYAPGVAVAVSIEETSSATSDFEKIMVCLKSIQSPSSWCETQLQLIKRNTGVVVMTGSAPSAAPTPSSVHGPGS
jgi:hypothetical protein